MNFITSAYSFFGRRPPRSLQEARRNLYNNLGLHQWSTITYTAVSAVLSVNMAIITHRALHGYSTNSFSLTPAECIIFPVIAAAQLSLTLVSLNLSAEYSLVVFSPFSNPTVRLFLLESASLAGASLLGLNASFLISTSGSPNLRTNIILSGSLSSVLYLTRMIIAFFSMTSTSLPRLVRPLPRLVHIRLAFLAREQILGGG
ncbi:hypothetical protein CLAVI_000540 [Candidatus Clavichlamydia salmonicola]|uniref:hypothetical protein n=1 Tax=Candidatus Clavichlamydia salmonicola TaxID=469812 RepID=UPI0018918385|nr:hypothetical protein [Candidatus Clavichlamydia salmonicola]MBF5050918.1 hypothetical protein [Candidatus Clavichlamydia salmonicola]